MVYFTSRLLNLHNPPRRHHTHSALLFTHGGLQIRGARIEVYVRRINISFVSLWMLSISLFFGGVASLILYVYIRAQKPQGKVDPNVDVFVAAVPRWWMSVTRSFPILLSPPSHPKPKINIPVRTWKLADACQINDNLSFLSVSWQHVWPSCSFFDNILKLELQIS
jgi:hypothetical protein